MTDIDFMTDIETAFDAEIKKLTAQREAETVERLNNIRREG
jgi:hypothetical protein